MAPQKYAKDQPLGFTNRIERVAIVGAGGDGVGSHMAKALLATGKHSVTAISRVGSTNTLPEGIKIARVNYDDESSLVSALKGQQFLIITLSVMAPRETQGKLIAAAAKAGVPWVMPNCTGPDFINESLAKENLIGAGVRASTDAIEGAGVSSWIALVCSFWYEHSLALGEGWFGFDFPNRKVTMIDDGKTRINTSTLKQCGRAIASLLSLKELPNDASDTAPTISQWRNQPVYISSFLASQRDMLDSVHRALGTKDADWEIKYEPSESRYKKGLELLKSGSHLGFGICMYTRTFYPNGDGNFQDKLSNEVLGLHEENIDDATVNAVKLVESGYSYR
ncbi:unnamed protein product [Clonostachys solani]|uniref:NmrA-like domain-containing protein n=1 Tax=Clonostachys solani TaxID=160281 RepID=A0A9N9Z814_9HYPO|nr:unnamed protein product [Clonostachys solani]